MEQHTEGALEAAKSLTILQQANKRREKREAHLFLDIPSWGGDLIGEYKIIEKNKITEIAERVATRMRSNQGNGQQTLDTTIGDIELIVHSCVGLHVMDPKSGTRIPLEDDLGHVGYGRIADVLGKSDDIESSTDAVRYLTGERDDETGTWVENAAAIQQHAQRIQRWMRDPSKRTTSLEEALSELG